jgi:ribonuclease BN (tRNA processing enzyme)
MKLTVVGCSGSTSGPASPASSYLVQAPHQGRTFSLVLDLGPGAFGALYNYLDPSEVDAIALSHLHPDHCLDVCAYYVWARYSRSIPWPPRPVYGPAGTAARMAAAYDVPSSTSPSSTSPGSTSPGSVDRDLERQPGIADYLDYRDWQPRQHIGPFDVRVARVDHPVEAYAIRIEERVAQQSSETTPDGPRAPGHIPTLVYSGDTGPCDALVELARGADLLLVESAFLDRPDNPPGLHLTPREAVTAGAEAGAGLVVLTHIPPWHRPSDVLDQALPFARGPVELAHTGARWTLEPSSHSL